MNHEEHSVKFETTLEIIKSESDDGEWRIIGVAAGTAPDTQGDVITEEAIVLMAEQINTSYVPFLDWHNKNSVMSEIGYLAKAWIQRPDTRLGVEVILDKDNPGAQYIWKKLDQNKKYGMSVKGNSSGWWYDFEKSTGNRVRKHKKVILDEISLTTKPIFTPSLGTVLKKAVDELTSEPVGETMETPETTGVTEVTTSASTQESSAPETNPVTETTEVEKAVSADNYRDTKKLAKLVRLHREMQELITELGLDSEGAESADSTETIVTAKSEDETTETSDSISAEVASLVKSALEENTATLRAEIAALKSLIPAKGAPGVLEKSEDNVDVRAVVDSLRGDPRNALRLALAAQHGELDRLTR